jgi:hypothetical protein
MGGTPDFRGNDLAVWNIKLGARLISCYMKAAEFTLIPYGVSQTVLA